MVLVIEQRISRREEVNFNFFVLQLWKKVRLLLWNFAWLWGFLRPKRKAHDQEVLTNYPGELIQHDSSHHLFAPYAAGKWYLITSIDDYSRLILYAVLVERETAWEHILALEAVLLKYGFPLAYYVDSHSIFRFVQGRDSFWRNHTSLLMRLLRNGNRFWMTAG